MSGILNAVISSLLVISSYSVPVLTECPDGYQTGYEDHCYYLQAGAETFDGARTQCLSTNNSDLVIINSQEELDYLLTEIGNLTLADDGKIWIGYFDISVEGDWRWADCQRSDNWQQGLWTDGEPSNDEKDCAALNHTKATIEDEACGVTYAFICEVNQKDFSREEANVQDVEAVPISWTETNVTWTVSDVSCDVYGYNVYYTPRNTGNENVTAVDGGDANGVTLRGLDEGVIYDISVAARQTDGELPEVGPISVCPYGYEEGPTGSCYYFSSSSSTYEWARYSCLSDHDSDLLIINDQDELDYILERLGDDDTTRWIGYFDRASEGEWTWADCKQSTPWQESLWSDDQPTGYNEDCGSLEKGGLLSDYVCDQYFKYICEISPKDFSRDDANARDVSVVTRNKNALSVSWAVSDVNCDVFGYTIRVRDTATQNVKVYYAHGGNTDSLVADGLQLETNYQVAVAGLQIDRQLTEVGYVSATTGCPSGYETSPTGDCYAFTQEGSEFDLARGKCLSDPGADLVIIDTQEELDYLLNRTSTNQSWWIGYFDISVEGSWTWADCQAATDWHKSLWAEGEPGNGVEDCGSLTTTDGTLSDNDCDISKQFICELSDKDFQRDEANVHNVDAVLVSEATMNVTWDVSRVNCDVIGYSIYYTPRSNGIRQVENVTGGDVDRVSLTGLEAWVIYDISVAAIQRDQELPEVSISVCPYLYDKSPEGTCYYFSSRTTSYQGARRSCLTYYDGDLVIISDQEEYDYLLQMTAADDTPRWIGYFDRATEGGWTWADCQNSDPWQESLWAAGEPTGYDEDCGALDPSDNISDYVCDQSFRYICEISPKGFSREDANAGDLIVLPRSQTSLTVNWKISDVNCDVFGYTIRVTDFETNSVNVYYAHGGETQSIVADGLEKATKYQVTVAGLQIDRQLPEVGFVNATTGCPNGYEESPSGRCYRFVEEARVFDSARRSCLSTQESDLLIIDSEDELEFIINATSELQDKTNWWIGFFDIAVEGTWTWADCKAATKWHESLWAVGEPGNGVEDCGSLNSTDGKLSDDVCDIFLPFICEQSIKEFSRDDANIQSLAAVPISRTGMNVTWEVSEVNCDVFGYNVYYAPKTTGVRHVETVYGGDANGITLTGLEAYVTYDIAVAALQTDQELPEISISVCPYQYDTSPDGTCYYFSSGTTSYQGARGSCLSDPNGDLVIISGQQEYDYLLQMTASDDTPRWIGYFDRATEGTWTWADCQDSDPWQESLWAAGEPTGYDEDCGALDLSDNLSDFVCDQSFKYICEISPKGFSRYDANAYDVTVSTRTQTSLTVNWKVSDVNCDVFGYTIRVSDFETNSVNVYYAHGGETQSIVADGLEKATKYQVTVAGLQIDRQLPEVGFVNATTGCPNGYEESPSGRCYRFVEQARVFDSARRSCLSTPESDLLIIDSEDELEFIINATSELQDNTNWWIGFFDIAVEGTWTWADCKAATKWHESLWAVGEPGNGVEDCGSLNSTDGELSGDVCDNFLPFICEQSIKEFSRDDANIQSLSAVPISRTGMNVTWEVSEVNCDVFGYNVYYAPKTTGVRHVETVYGGDANGITLTGLEAYVTYDIAVAALQTDQELPEISISVCPYQYDTSPDGTCYYFSSGTTSYQGARGSCLSDPNGDLVIISDQQEYDYLLQMTASDDTPRWIGYFDRATEGTWTGADCQNSDPWQESLWAAGEPTGYDEDCGALDLSDNISDYVCDQFFRYICEISPKGFSRDEANAFDVTVSTRTQTSLTVNWKVSDVNCDVFGYTIRVTDFETNFVNVYYAHGGGTQSIVADGLEMATKYQVTVAGLQIDRQLPEVGFVNATIGCPGGYTESPTGGCYRFVADGRIFDSARRSCLSGPDSDLVIIDAQEELDYLLNATAAMKTNQSWWIGLFDISVENTWTWIDCQQETEWHVGLWSPGEPSDSNEDCGSFRNDDGRLSADVCDTFLPYICEITPKGFSRDEANVQSVTATPVSETEVNVTWEVSSYNCDVIGYNVYYTPRTTGIRHVQSVYGGDVNGVTLENLDVYVIYDIGVAALQFDRELPVVDISVCPYPYVTSPSGGCYYFSSGSYTYQRARSACLSGPNSDLLIINDQEEFDYVTGMTSDDDLPRWIGYFDRATEGQWTWADCQSSDPWQESLWAGGEPTGFDEDCGALGLNDKLSDHVCDQYFRYICEISPKGFSRDEANAFDVTVSTRTQTSLTVNWKVSDVNCDVFGYTIRVTDFETNFVNVYYAHGGETQSIVADGLEMGIKYQVTVAGLQIDRQLPKVGFVNATIGCPGGYTESPTGGCYRFVADGRIFDSARRSCLSGPDSDLVIIDSQEELDYLLNATAAMKTNQSWWIGFFDISVENIWTWVDCQQETEWHVGLWSPGEPSDTNVDCGSFSNDDGTLSADVCDTFLPYICEITLKGFSRDEANVQSVAAIPVSETEVNVTWEVSVYNCDVIGYNVHYTPRTTGIRHVQPVYGGDVNGVTLENLDVYVIYDIGVAALQFDRELPVVDISVCPYSYVTSPSGGCYYFSSGSYTYQRARSACLSGPNIDLLIISDQEEFDYVTEMTSDDVLPRWIGYFDRATEGQWTWADCQSSDPWQESLWAEGEPTGYDEDCGALDLNDKLSDFVCDQYFKYICEISPTGFSRDVVNAYDVTAVPRTQTSITVRWKVSEFNCDVFGYTIRVTDVSSQSMEVYYSHGGDTTELIADGLQRATSYQVTVAGLQIDRQLPQVGFIDVTTACPSGYTTSPMSGCYYFGAEARTYDSARRVCVNQPDSDLVIIDTEEELNYLWNTASMVLPNADWWIGFTDIAIEGIWKWADCQPPNNWQNSLWGNGEPDNGIEDCGSISFDTGTISDNVCDIALPYMCEITEKGFSRDDANVRNVAAVPMSETEINVTWDVSPYSCDVIGYNVYYTPRTSGIRFVVTEYSAYITATTLTDLESYVIYDISVAALQLDRELPAVGPVAVCPYLYETSPSGGCYYFSRSTTTYERARDSCLYGPNEDLVIINDWEELNFLAGLTANDDVPRWIGYFDRATESHWTWADCQSSDSWQESLWAAGEPTGYDEDCGALDLSDNISDYVCDQYFRYICEISPKEFSRDDANAYDVTVVPRTHTSLTVKWKVSDVNCDVFGYTIRVTDVITEYVNVYYAHGGETTTLDAGGLDVSTAYEVTVAGLQIDRQLPQVGFVRESTGCPGGYVTSPIGGCYHFNPNARTFDWARQTCLSDPDGDLVIIDTVEEHSYLKDTAESGNWWIGFFDVSVESSWTWADCRAASEWDDTLWADGEPGNGVEDCGSFSATNGTIADRVCDVFLPFICELTTKDFSRDDANVEDVSAVAVSESAINVTWGVSPVSCDVFGYNVYFTSSNDDIGYSATIYGGDVDSVVLEDLQVGAVYDISVAALQLDRELPQVGPVTVCPYNYEMSPTGACYYFSRDDSSYQWARSSCLATTDSDLVIISDQQEWEYLLERTSRNDTRWWIGYFDRATEGVWTWADCQLSNPWQEQQWGINEPTGYDEDCGALEVDGALSDYVCDQYFQYICEISPKGFSRDDANAYDVGATPRSTTSITVSWEVSDVSCDVYGYTIRVTDIITGSIEVYYAHGGATGTLVANGLYPDTTYRVTVAGLQIDRQLPEVGFVDVTTGCPDGFEEFRGSCYGFLESARQFSSARSTCLSYPDGDLAIIDTPDELDFLVNGTSTRTQDQMWWIGFFDIAVEGMWTWADCQAADDWHETLWANGEPGNGIEDCGALNNSDATLSDNVCDLFLPAICEITPKGFSRDEANVANVAALPTSNTEAEVTWGVSEVNCDVFGYNVYYTARASGLRSVKPVFGGDSNSTTITDLQVGAIYDVSVAALQTDRELPEVGPASFCPFSYVERAGSCYYFSTGESPYEWARANCLSHPDGDLVIIDDQEELDFLLDKVSDGNDHRWIGYFDRAKEGTWTWADCKNSDPWQESLWAAGEPTGYDEDCGAVSSAGLLSDFVCDQYYEYICEISPKGFSRDDANAKGVMAVSTSTSEVNVTWSTSDVNCDVYGYTIRLTDVNNGDRGYHYAHGGNTNQITVSGLAPGSTHLVTVAGLQIERELPETGFINVTTDCPSSMESAPIGGCYYFSSMTKTLDDWRSSCQTEHQGGDVVIIDKQKELDYLLSATSQRGIADFWLGYFDFSVEGNWRWATCEASTPWQEGLWAPDEPGDVLEDCSILTSSGSIESVDCDQTYPVVCEYIRKSFNVDDVNVKKVAATATGSSVILVMWEVSPVGCDIIGFRIYYASESEPALEESVQVFGGDIVSAELQDLAPETTYTIHVAALHWMEELDKVGPAQATTLPGCEPQELIEPSGVIQSPAYPEPYPPYQDCVWSITLPAESGNVLLSFETFDLENGVDYLYVGEGTATGENVLAELTGSELPDDILTTTHQVWIRFTSNSDISGSGFRVTYSTSEAPTTPSLESRQDQSVIIRIINKALSWLNEDDNRLKLATAVAQALNEYCADYPGTCQESTTMSRQRRQLLAMEYQADDVDFVLEEEVGSDLEVYTWVWESSSPGEGVTQDVLKTALDENEETVIDVMDDPDLEFQTDLPVTEKGDNGLEAWSIALIIASAVLVLILIVGYIELKARQKAKPYSHDEIDEVDGLSNANSDQGTLRTPAEVEEGSVVEATRAPDAGPQSATTATRGSELGESEPDHPEKTNGTVESSHSEVEEDKEGDVVPTSPETSKPTTVEDQAEPNNMKENGAKINNSTEDKMSDDDDIPLVDKSNQEDYQGIVNEGYENKEEEVTKL